MLVWTMHGPEKSTTMAGPIDKLFLAYPDLKSDYHMHIQKMSMSRADVRVKNPQLRLPANKLRSGERFFGFRQCTFHSHRATVGEGTCPHALTLGGGHAPAVPPLPAHLRRDSKEDEVESDAEDADHQLLISPVRDLNEMSYLDLS
jgi:hypothetical protein